MQNLKDIAAQQVRGNAAPSPSQLTSAADLMSQHQTAIVTTSAGHTFEIRSLASGDLYVALGSPLMRFLANQGIEAETPEEIEKAAEQMGGEHDAELLSDPEFLAGMRKIVCQGVTSVQFVDRPPQNCDVEQNQVSVDVLGLAELCELHNAIMQLSISPEEIAEASAFREEGEGGGSEQEPAGSGADGGEVRPEAQPNAVSNEDE